MSACEGPHGPCWPTVLQRPILLPPALDAPGVQLGSVCPPISKCQKHNGNLDPDGVTGVSEPSCMTQYNIDSNGTWDIYMASNKDGQASHLNVISMVVLHSAVFLHKQGAQSK